MFMVGIALLIGLGEIGLGLKANLFWRITTAVMLVGFAIFIWSTWFAPRATARLELPWLALAKLALFGITSVGLYITDNKTAAFALMGAFVIIESLALAWGQEDPSAHGV